MDFLRNLRMSSIYGGDTGRGLKKLKYMDNGDPLQEVLRLGSDWGVPVQEEQPSNLDNIFMKLGIGSRNKMDTVYKPPISETQNKPITPYQRESLQLRGQSIANQHSRGMESARIQDERTEIQRLRAGIYEWKARNPNMQIKAVRGGNYVGINPVTGDTIDLGIPTGTLSREDELELIQGNAIERQNNQGEINERLIDRRGNIQSRHITERGDQTRRTKQTPSAADNDRMLPTQERVAVINRAREFGNKNPWARNYIVWNQAGNGFTLMPEGTKGSRPLTAEESAWLNKNIYGDGTAPQNTFTDTTNNPNPAATKQTSAPQTGQTSQPDVIMVTPDGRKIYVPANEVADAIANGAKKFGGQ